MADYLTQFSCRLEVGTSKNAARALAIHNEMADALERDDIAIGFQVIVDPTTVGSLLIRDDGGFGEPEHVFDFVLRCAKALDLTGRWGFAWALTCSRPRVDSFGGGAQVLDLGARESLAWTDCEHWMSARLGP